MAAREQPIAPHYRHMSGHKEQAGTKRARLSQVKSVFPWERREAAGCCHIPTALPETPELRVLPRSRLLVGDPLKAGFEIPRRPRWSLKPVLSVDSVKFKR